MKEFYLKLGSKLFPNYYSDLNDFPIGRFSDCLSGDLKKISRNKFYDPKKANKAWVKLFNQHIRLHGLPDSYIHYIKTMSKILNYYDQSFKGKKWMSIKAKIHEKELESTLNLKGDSIHNICGKLSQYMGFPVRSQECSVVEFYSYINIVTQSNGGR